MVERRVPCGQLVEHYAKSPPIRSHIVPVFFDDFRRHILGSSCYIIRKLCLTTVGFKLFAAAVKEVSWTLLRRLVD